MRRLLVLAIVLLALTACTKPPYQKPQAAEDDLAADYQDCYSLGCLTSLTPGQSVSVQNVTQACMQTRGYRSAGLGW